MSNLLLQAGGVIGQMIDLCQFLPGQQAIFGERREKAREPPTIAPPVKGIGEPPAQNLGQPLFGPIGHALAIESIDAQMNELVGNRQLCGEVVPGSKHKQLAAHVCRLRGAGPPMTCGELLPECGV